MKKTFYFLSVLLLNLGSLSAQIFKSDVNPFPTRNVSNLADSDTLKILAVMVEFQEDKYDATIGNGKFGSVYSQEYGQGILDPLPHNADYFADHLEFAKSYFNRVSKGKLNITYDILPQVFTLSQTMRGYSPPYNSDDLSALGYLAQETWQLVDQNENSIDSDKYDLFVIFHPGVSRGLDFGTYYLDRNLPSVYLSLNALKNVFGNDFNGFPVGDNNSLIKNSILLPETESRELEAVDGSIVLLQLTINGLIAANIASYLGLPDLFNTETGLSVIGRFGLMDGQAMYANSGMFPPEPSPWEKIFLGWEMPVTMPVGNAVVNLTTRATAVQTDTTLVKIPLNESEYYLIENRSQDANGDNATVTYKVGDQLFQKTFTPDSTGYFIINPDSLRGVVVDVDEYDVSVPGSGIVIWHIDDKIIDQNFADNTINVDDERRGVDVEEADGIQDVGVQFESVFGTYINEGSPEDFWYAGNTAELYQNKFSTDTKPNTNTNLGGNSLITIDNFSALGNRMSFALSYGENDLQFTSRKSFAFAINENTLTCLGNGLPYSRFMFLSGSGLNILDNSGSIIKTISNFSTFKPATYSTLEQDFIVGVTGSIINLFVNDSWGTNQYSQDIGVSIIAPPVLRVNSNDEWELVLATITGGIAIAKIGDIINGTQISISQLPLSTNQIIQQVCADENYFCVITQNYFIDSNGANIYLSETVKHSILTKDINNQHVTVILTSQNHFYIIKNSSIENDFEINTGNELKYFVLSDLFKDGQNYIVFTDGEQVSAINFVGRYAANFPLYDPEGMGFEQRILVVDLNGDDTCDIITETLDGRIFAFTGRTGEVLPGYPITSGSGISNIMVSVITNPLSSSLDAYKTFLAVIDDENTFRVWKVFNDATRLNWSEYYGSSLNNSFVAAPSIDNVVNEFFPKDKAYNWPNPVYENETYIRYFVSEDSDVSIKIFDLAGDLVAKLTDHATGGYDNETTWSVANIQSGVYFARLEVTGVSGKADSKVIKIAVIK